MTTKTNKIDQEINNLILELGAGNIVGKFYVGILNELQEFIKFYLAADYYQENISSSQRSILEHANTEFQKKLTDLEFCDTYQNEVTYTNGKFYDNSKNEIKAEEVFIYKDGKYLDFTEERKKNYRNILEKFYSLNNKKRVLRVLNQKDFFSSESEFHKNKFNGHAIKDFQIQELNDLMEIKTEKFLSKENKTYRRLISDKNYKKLINFKNIKEFVELLKDKIKESDYDYKSILYYKLEKSMGFEIIKYILKAVSKKRVPNNQKSEVYDDLLILIKVPLFKSREKYVDLYLSLAKDERKEWVIEINTLMWLIENCILEGQKLVDIEPVYDNILKNYDNTKKESSEYRPRKHFSAKDFKKLMSRIDNVNKQLQLLEEVKLDKLKV